MDYETAIERACRHAHEQADAQTRNTEHGGTYLKHLALARFYEVAAENDVDLDGKSVGDISVDILRGTRAVRKARGGV